MKITSTVIAIILIISFIFRINDFISIWLINIGVPGLRYQELWFFLLPGLYIMTNANKNGRLSFPHLLSALVFFFVFWFLETIIHKSTDFDSWSDLPVRFYYLLLSFYFLSNLHKSHFLFVIKITYIVIALKVMLIYMSLMGVVNIVQFETLEAEKRIAGSVNLNTVNDQVVLGFLLMLFLFRINYKNFIIFRIKIIFILSGVFMIPLIIIGGSRGAFILLIAMLLIVFYKKLGRYKIAITSLTVLLILVGGAAVKDYAVENIGLINRLENTGTSQMTGKAEGRLLQIYASWENFSSNKLFGVGYESAAGGVFEGISRSNFVYTQVLATGGIVLFIVFINLIFRLFGSSVKSMKNNPFLLASLAYILILFIFRRPDLYLGVLAYFVHELRRMKSPQFKTL